VVLVVRALQLKSSMKSLNGSLTPALTALNASAEVTQERALALDEHTERLTAATARLQQSVARLRVLTGAADELRRSAAGVRRAVPKK
jgi:cell division protein ZapA (FtsZ GTPase activity inhibitor)